MFPFWKPVMEPIVRAARARRVVEIGALRGENTVQILDALPADGELHVIDPLPQFDPAEHRARFGERYVFHEAISHDVLPDLGPVDVAIIDGDHNWYTVFHELRMLDEVAAAHGAPLPVLLLHDVAWPYGYRDLYYAPERIPEEFRQPFKHAGMRPGRSELAPRGGLNHQMANAEHEGGERNGVMRALEDFIEASERDLRHVTIPIYFGLSIVVEAATLEANPELAAVIEHVQSAEGRRTLLELGEEIRVGAMVWTHSVEEYRGRLYDHATSRLLDVVKSALVNDHYLEHEVRLAHLLDAVERGRGTVDRAVLRDPARALRGPTDKLRAARAGGGALTPDTDVGGFWPWAPSGRRRLDRLHDLLEAGRAAGVVGDYVDCHVARGGTSILMAAFRDAYQLNDRSTWLVDEFGLDVGATGDPLPSDLNLVREGLHRFGVLDERVRFAQGPLPDALVDADLGAVSVLRVGGNDLERTTAALDALHGRLVVGGAVVVDTTSHEVTEGVLAWLRARGGGERAERLDETGLTWVRADDPPGAGGAGGRVSAPARPARRPALAPDVAPGDLLDLSVVVTFYDMAREARRTLHSLSRSYQRDLDGVEYEVLVVDNGSHPDQALDADEVATFGPEFRLVDVAEHVAPSPTTALNAAVRESRGRAVALMIDGAHVLTPGVLSGSLAAMERFGPAVVLTQQWYVGPGQQHDVMTRGYDRELEDELFARIEWPSDGYRLFEIGSFIGDRDWFEGMGESNCLVVPRPLLRQVGAFDDSFSTAGGSFANLDLYERLGSSPDVQLVSLLGEASFHQLHDGTTTNEADGDARGRMLTAYREEYEALRGRPFTGPGRPIVYVGSLHGAAKRTRARRMLPTAFPSPRVGGPDGRPERPVPMSDDLKSQFVDSYWSSFEWHDPTWLGRRLRKSPIDLMTYQEIVVETRPDWIVDVGTGGGGRATFLASVCDLLGHGRVVSVGPPSDANLVEHDRIEWVRADPASPEGVARVRELVGDGSAMVICSVNGKPELTAAFDAYADLVPVDGYVVFEETIVNGNPVWAGYGKGPDETVREIIRSTSDFYVDRSRERFAATFNVGGYLRRHRAGPPAGSGA